jgi:PST family polysaccharide transporter
MNNDKTTPKSLFSQLRSGAIISFAARYSEIAIQILVTAVLSRLLTPSDFGVVAVITVFVVFFQILSSAGIGPAIIQEDSLDQQETATIFNLTILIGLAISLGFFALGPVLASIYKDAVYVKIARLLSLSLFFNTLNIVPQALLRKRRRFGLHGFCVISAHILAGVLAVFLAFTGASYFALVYRAIASAFFSFAFCAFAARLPLMAVFSLAVLKRIARYSTYQFMFNFINYFSRNLDKLLIGRFMGPAALGYYEKSYRLMMLPLQSFTYALSPVLHPVLSGIKTDLPSMFRAYLQISRLLALIGFPLSVFLAFSAKEIVLIVFGTQWGPSVPVFEILSLSVGIQMVLSSTGSVFQAAGRTDLLFLSGFLSAITMVGGTIVGIILDSMEFLATALVLAFAFNFVQGHYFLIRRALNGSQRTFYKRILSPFITGLGIAVVLFLTQSFLKGLYINLFFSLIIKTFVTAAAFFLSILATGDLKLILRLVRK